MKFLRFRTLGAATAVAATALSLSALPASARDWQENAAGGTYSYDDSADRFCVKAYNGDYSISVRLVNIDDRYPWNTSPDRKVADSGGSAGGDCTSLATAYEGTRYKAVVISSTPRDPRVKEIRKFRS